MSWGAITASADTPTKLEKALNDAASEYFDRIVERDTKDEQKHAKAAAKAAKELAKEMDFVGMVEVTLHGQTGVPGTGVPSGVSISLIDLQPPDPEPPTAENEPAQAENGQNSAENGQN